VAGGEVQFWIITRLRPDRQLPPRPVTAGERGVPIVIRAPSRSADIHGGRSIEKYEAMFTNTPGMKTSPPSSGLRGEGADQVGDRDGDPVLFEHKATLYRRIKEELTEGDYTVRPARRRWFGPNRPVDHSTYGAMVHAAKEAAVYLGEEGISVKSWILRHAWSS